MFDIRVSIIKLQIVIWPYHTAFKYQYYIEEKKDVYIITDINTMSIV